MKNKTCPKCGENNVPSDFQYCWNCGYAFSGSDPSSSGVRRQAISVPKPKPVSNIKCDSCGTTNSSFSRFCSNCGNELQTLGNIQSLYIERIENLSVHVDELSTAIEDVESSLEKLNSRLKKYERIQLPESSLFSHSLAQRAFTVYGHLLLAQFLISIPLVIISIVFGLIPLS